MLLGCEGIDNTKQERKRRRQLLLYQEKMLRQSQQTLGANASMILALTWLRDALAC